MFLRRVSSTVKTLTTEMMDCRDDEDRFASLAATMEQIIPTMSDAEADYMLERLSTCLPERHVPLLSLYGHRNSARRQQIAADLIVLLRRRNPEARAI